MENVTRYGQTPAGFDVMLPHSEGGWVKASDYDALQQEIDSLTAKLAAAESAVQISTNAFCMQTNLIATLEQRLAAMEIALKDAPTGKLGETHGDLLARYYIWYETTRAKAVLEGEGG